MGIVKLSELLHEAQELQYAVGYFEAWDMYSLEAVLEAAEEEDSPVVLGFGGMMPDQAWLSRFGIEPVGAYLKAMADQARVPVAVILNEVWEMEHAKRGVESGFNTVMLNTCHLPFEKNVALTRELVDYAHNYGVEVQAELGQLPNFGEDMESSLTDPKEAEDFVRQTGVDFLAISIGNVHLQTDGKSSIKVDLLREIRSRLTVPIIIHGGTGFPDDVVELVIDEGCSMFHVGTALKKTWLEGMQEELAQLSGKPNCQELVGSRKAPSASMKQGDVLLRSKMNVKKAVKDFMRLYRSSGKIKHVLESR